MSYIACPTADGLYMLHPQAINKMIYDAYYYKSQLENSKEAPTKEGFGLPETYHYEVDFARCKADGHRGVFAFWASRAIGRKLLEREHKQTIPLTGAAVEALREDLVDLQLEARAAKRRFREKQDQASVRSMRNITDTAGRWEQATEVAKFVRDASADVLLVTAGVASGGTMLLVGGGASLLKGVGKYQDTGKVGAAVVTAGMSFVTVMIPGGESVSHLGKGAVRTLVFTKKGVELTGNIGVSLIEGKSLGEATLSGVLDLGLSAAAGKMTGAMLPKSHLEAFVKANGINTALPASVRATLLGNTMVNTRVGSQKGKLNDALTKKLIGLLGNEPKAAKVAKPAPKIPLGEPIFADLAILGPDQSFAARRFAA